MVVRPALAVLACWFGVLVWLCAIVLMLGISTPLSDTLSSHSSPLNDLPVFQDKVSINDAKEQRSSALEVLVPTEYWGLGSERNTLGNNVHLTWILNKLWLFASPELVHCFSGHTQRCSGYSQHDAWEPCGAGDWISHGILNVKPVLAHCTISLVLDFIFGGREGLAHNT